MRLRTDWSRANACYNFIPFTAIPRKRCLAAIAPLCSRLILNFIALPFSAHSQSQRPSTIGFLIIGFARHRSLRLATPIRSFQP